MTDLDPKPSSEDVDRFDALVTSGRLHMMMVRADPFERRSDAHDCVSAMVEAEIGLTMPRGHIWDVVFDLVDQGAFEVSGLSRMKG